MAKEKKRLEKPHPPGTFVGGVVPRGIVAWAVLPIMQRQVLSGGAAPGVITGRGLHSCTFRLNLSACCGIGVH